MAAPPSYKDITSVVSDCLTKGSDVRGWQLDAKEDGRPRRINAFPFASAKAVGAHLSYQWPGTNVTLKSRASGAFQSWYEYLPTIIYQTKINGTSGKVELDTAARSLKVTAKHPVFNASVKSAPLDGFSTDANVTTRVADQTYAGLSVQYDPKRSGVADLTAVLTRYACPNIYKGDLLGQYSLRNGFSVQMRVPMHTYLDAAVIAGRKRFIAGVQARSPCGARIMLNANVTDSTCSLTAIRGFNDIWKITATVTAPLPTSNSAAAPRFGLKFTHVDSTE